MPFTPDSDLELLFPEELVPLHIKGELPPELHVRLPALGIPFFYSFFYLFIPSFFLSSPLFFFPCACALTLAFRFDFRRRFAHWLRQTTSVVISPCSECSRKRPM